MASRSGKMIAGTDGSDYSHRETVVKQYYVSSQHKNYLKYTVFLHWVLAAVMVLKLFPEVLTHADVHVPALQDLKVPKSFLWEWIWLLSTPATLLALTACKKSNAPRINKFIHCTFFFGVLPIIYAGYHFSKDWYSFSTSKGVAKLEYFMGYPVFYLWFLFLMVAIKAHCLELYFARNLASVWQPPRKKD